MNSFELYKGLRLGSVLMGVLFCLYVPLAGAEEQPGEAMESMESVTAIEADAETVTVPITPALLRKNRNSESVVFLPSDTQKLPKTVEEDHKWQYHVGKVFANPGEAPAPLQFEVTAPDGYYRLLLDTYMKRNYHGFPASQILVRLPAHRPLLQVGANEAGEFEGEQGYRYMPAGVCQVTGGSIKLVVIKGADGYWAFLRAIRLVPVSEEVYRRELAKDSGPEMPPDKDEPSAEDSPEQRTGAL